MQHYYFCSGSRRAVGRIHWNTSSLEIRDWLPIMMVFSFASFLGGISAAIVVKLTSSIDDVLWLSAFLTPKLSHHQRTQNAMTYTVVCLLQTCLAFIISTFGEKGIERLVGRVTRTTNSCRRTEF